MDDNQNKNQPNSVSSDYQKILDEYAASVKPESSQPLENLPEEKIPVDSLKETISLPQEPKKITAETPEKTLADDLAEAIAQKKQPEPIKPSPVSEPPIHPSLVDNLDENDVEQKPINLPPASTLETEKPVATVFEPIKNQVTENQTSKSEIPQPEKTPEEIKAEINRLLTDDETKTNTSVPSSSKPNSSVGKVFFTLALILFFAVAAGLSYFLFLVPSNSSNSTKSTNDNAKTDSTTPTDTPADSDGVCELNGKTYQVGESFASADGCNTCSCSSAGVITCTEMACTGTPAVTSATPSAQKSSNLLSSFKVSYTTSTDINNAKYQDSTFSEILKKTTSVTGLIVDMCSHQTMPTEIGQFTNLISLSLYGSVAYNENNCKASLFTTIDNDSISKLKKLSILNISGEKLTTIPDSILTLSTIKTLRFNNSIIKTVPTKISNLKNLETLDLSFNENLTSIPSLSSLTNLKKVVLINDYFANSKTEQTKLTTAYPGVTFEFTQ